MATTSEFNFRPLGLGLGTPGCPFMVMSIGAGANVAKVTGLEVGGPRCRPRSTAGTGGVPGQLAFRDLR